MTKPTQVDTAERLRMLAAPSRDNDWVRVKARELRSAAAEIDQARRTIATMRTALEPFAEMADLDGGIGPAPLVYVEQADCRRAAQALHADPVEPKGTP